MSIAAAFILLFDKKFQDLSDYEQIERCAMRLRKKDMEKVDQIMEQVFKFPKKKKFN